MKTFKSAISALLAILLLSATALSLCSCGLSGTKKDAYGYRRSKDAWLFECLLLPEDPGSFADVFGEDGESGLISKRAAQKDGELNTSGSNYLVGLWYGMASTATPTTCLRFTLINETGVYYDDECIEITAQTYSDSSKGFFKGFPYPKNERVYVSTDKNVIQGGFILEFSLRDGMEGDLYVDCYVESADEVAETYVDRGFSTKVSHSDAAVTANVENATVRYLTKDAYNEGDFTDDALLSEPPYDAGSVVYTVIDFSLKAAKNNDGGHTMGVMFSVSNQFALYSNIEDAPTNKIMKKANGSSMNLYAAYTVPATKGEAKDIRMIFETVILGGGAVSVDVYLVGAPDVVLNGTTHMKALPERTVTGHALEYRLSVDRTFYTVASVFSNSLANIDIPDALEDGIPVTAIEVGTFSNLTHITSVTIGDNVTSLSDGAFTGCIALESVRLGTGITSIGTDAFAYTAVTVIEFDGTKEQWNAIEKAEGWAGNSSITGVTCSDGTVSPNGSTSSNWPFIESPV